VKSLPYVHWMPRVSNDLKQCLRFVAERSGGNTVNREREIFAGMAKILRHPKASRVGTRRLRLGIDLRGYHVAQFVIIYAYFEPNAVMESGMVSIRAIRHRRVRNPFHGVKEPVAHNPFGGASSF